MAIDSEDKRRSVAEVLPKPDTAITPGDRRHVSDTYRMQLPGTPGPLQMCSYRKHREGET